MCVSENVCERGLHMCLCGQLLKMQANAHKRTDPKILRVKVMQALHTHESISICVHIWMCVCVCVLVVTPTLQNTHRHTQHRIHVVLTYEDSLVSFLARKSNQHTQQSGWRQMLRIRNVGRMKFCA